MKRKVCFLAFVFMFFLFIEFNVSVKSDNPELEIVDFYSCDQSGFFRWCFEVNSTIYLNLTIRNLTPNPKNVTISVTVYDDCDVPIGNEVFDTTIPSNACKYYIVIFTIPLWAYVGEGKAYADILEEGVPITSEKATNFYISLECTFTNVTVHVQDLCGNSVFAQASISYGGRIVAKGYTDDLGNFNTSLLSCGYTAKAWNVNGWNSSTCSFNVPDTTYVIIILSREERVGGISIPVNKLSLLAPYIGLTILLAATVVTVVYVKKRKRHKN